MSNGQAEHLGVTYNKHTSEAQLRDDSSSFFKRMDWASNIKERDEPGDMRNRGPWSTEGDFMFRPYAQISCAYGECIVNRVDHLEKAKKLVEKYGRIFIFTLVNKSLIDAALARPKDFVPLCTTESWMYGNNDVVLFGAINKKED